MRSVATLTVLALLLGGCTVVDVDLQADTAQVSVWTFATSRQALLVEKLADGTVRWTVQDSSPDARIGAALQNATATAARLSGAPVAP